jgi:hypothetical protein
MPAPARFRPASRTCDDPGITGGDDCDDADDTEFPGQNWYPNCDGDVHFARVGREVIACDPAEADTLTNCADGEAPDGGWSSSAGDDCDDEDNNVSSDLISWYPDCDNDTVFGFTETPACNVTEADGLTSCADNQPPDGGWRNTIGDDCDDEDANSFPGATELCDGNDNACTGTVPDDELDLDLDTFVTCAPWNDTQGDDPGIISGGDCDDGNAIDFPNQVFYPDCDDDGFHSPTETLACDLALADSRTPCEDGQPPDGGWRLSIGDDCDDEDANSYPGAAEFCDGNDNACLGSIPADELDLDIDMFATCASWNDTQGDDPGITSGGDCDDGDPTAFPGATEVCGNSIDEDCDGLDDDVPNGVCDTGGTGFCTAGNTGATCTTDSDCDLCVPVPISALPEVTRVALEGTSIMWWANPTVPSYHVYRGDLSALRDHGTYTQDPLQEPNASQTCGVIISPEDDPFVPLSGQAVFYLISADDGLMEGSLGADSSGVQRPNANPCQ